MSDEKLHQQTTIILSGALFSAEGKLLLLRRADNQQWELPGGTLEFGEPPETGLARCFSETTDLDVSADRSLGAWSTTEQQALLDSGAAGQASSGTLCHVVHIDYTVRLMGALLTVDIDRERHTEFAWLTRDAALERADSPALRTALQRAFDMLTRARKNG
ncbi:MAG TPA: NUDIX hydrolase [Planctomycetota bacterium]